MKISPDIKFYDTSALLSLDDLDFNERFIISSVTLQELENIKSSQLKDQEIKFKARELLNLLNNNQNKYEVFIHNNKHCKDLANAYGFEINNDIKILSDAVLCNNTMHLDLITFVTNDLCLKQFANLFFGDQMIQNVEEIEYTGYKDLILDND